MKNFKWAVFVILTLSLLQLGMGRREGQYDEEARAAERQEKLARKAEKRDNGNPVKNFFTGIKQATVDNTRDIVSETSEGVRESPIEGTVDGVNRGSEKVLDNTVSGVSKVATLGYGEVRNYEISEPEKGTDDTTKIKIKIPGT